MPRCHCCCRAPGSHRCRLISPVCTALSSKPTSAERWDRLTDVPSFHRPCSTYHANNVTNRHTHPFNGPLSGTTRVSRYQKVKPIWILLKQETVSGIGISWAIRKSAPRSRQITMPPPPLSFFTGQMLFLPSNQQHQSTEGKVSLT